MKSITEENFFHEDSRIGSPATPMRYWVSARHLSSAPITDPDAVEMVGLGAFNAQVKQDRELVSKLMDSWISIKRENQELQRKLFQMVDEFADKQL